MSTRGDLVLSHLTDEPQGRAALAEATGLEAQAVSIELNALQGKGLAERRDGGWCAGSGERKEKVRVHHIAEPDEAETKPARRETQRAPRETKARAPKALPPPAASVPHTNGRSCEFAIAESGAILFKVTHGPKAGELVEIGCADAMALYRLMSAVEFITENA
jgi:hypothetical protein